MNPFARTRPKRVVRAYGRDSFLIWLNPLISAFQASLGFRVGLRSDAEVLAKMQKDADEMAKLGYRVVSADEYALPLLGSSRQGATYYKVTYELTGDG